MVTREGVIYIPATFLQRLFAFLIDYIFILIYLAFIFGLGTFIVPQMQQLFTYSPAQSQLFGFLLVTLPVSAYYVIFDSRIGVQSIGKRKIGIRVVSRSGQPLSLWQSAIRTAIKFTPWELAHFLVHRLIWLGEQDMPFAYYLVGILVYGAMFAYLFTAIFSRRKRALYDMITQTEVVKA